MTSELGSYLADEFRNVDIRKGRGYILEGYSPQNLAFAQLNSKSVVLILVEVDEWCSLLPFHTVSERYVTAMK